MAMNNSLAEVRPELVPEWSEKNLPLKPDEITFGSNKKVWWRGACGHESHLNITISKYMSISKGESHSMNGLEVYDKMKN